MVCDTLSLFILVLSHTIFIVIISFKSFFFSEYIPSNIPYVISKSTISICFNFIRINALFLSFNTSDRVHSSTTAVILFILSIILLITSLFFILTSSVLLYSVLIRETTTLLYRFLLQ